MTLSASRVSPRIGFFLGAVAAAALILAPQAALAQHGGGHSGGGGGHFGGGGGHLGGSSGGSHASARATASHSGSGSSASTRPPSAPAAQSNIHNNASNNFSAGPRPLSSSGMAPGLAAFAHGDAAVNAGSNTAAPHMTIGFPPSSASGAEHWQPVTPVHGGVLSFSGQGHEIWQNSPSVPAATSALAGSRPFENQLAAHPRMFPPRRFHPGPIFFGPGFGFYPFFGFGFGLNCDPFFWNWDAGCNGLGYWGPYSSAYCGGYYPSDMYLGAGGYGNADAGPDTSQTYGQYAPQNPPPDSSEGATTPVVMLYLNDGTSFAVTDYWVADYKLHYVTEDAREGALDLDQIDVQRTVDMNASRGVTVTLKPAPAPQP